MQRLLLVLLDGEECQFQLEAGEELHHTGSCMVENRVGRTTDGVTFNLLGELLEHVDFALASLALFEALHDLFAPLAAFATGSALAAAFVLIKGRESADGSDDVGALVHDDHCGGAETALAVLEGVKVHELRVADVLGQDWCRATAWDDGFEIVPTADYAAAVFVDQLAEWDAHLFFDDAGVVHVAGDAE